MGFNKNTNQGAKATGFEIFGNTDIITNNVLIDRCLATDIIANNPEDKQCAGFTTALCDNVSFIKCTSKNNRCINGNAIGFGWAPDPRPNLVG